MAGLYVLHQDAWNWNAVTPLAFGFLPPALWYHVVYTLAVALALGWMVRYAWPSDLDKDDLDKDVHEGGGRR